MNLNDLFILARTYPDFETFEQIVKSEITDKPITQEIDTQLYIVEIEFEEDTLINFNIIALN